ncbi:hypothetical protein EDF68_11718 [Ochrobactrum sp. BH3]|nr:hypothetical protein EDF68_11718 [Ochrobactrum sp. BH3]
MSTVRFQKFWKENFQEYPPIIWILRDLFKENWVRFYSLPKGKQFPTRPEEFSTALHRYNEISNSIFVEHEDIWLILATYTIVDRRFLENSFIPMQKLYYVGEESITDTHGYIDRIEIYCKEIKWGSYDSSIIYNLIIDESIPQILFISKNGDMFAPYTGGSDIIIQDTARLQALRLRFEGWMSDLESGL